MNWIALSVVCMGAILPYYIVRRWRNWIGVLAGIVSGVVGTFALVLLVAFALNSQDPAAYQGGAMAIWWLTYSSWSIVISPIAALVAWVKGRGKETGGETEAA